MPDISRSEPGHDTSGPRDPLTRHVRDLVAVIDATGAVAYVNPAVTGLLGYAITDVTGRSLLDFVHPDDRDLVEKRLALAAADAPPAELPVLRLEHASGSWLAIEAVTTNLLHDPEVAGIVVVARDVTARLEDEARVAVANARLEAVLDTTTDAVVSVDRSGMITFFNSGAETIFGWTTRDVVGRSLEMLLPERYRRAHDGQLEDFSMATANARRMAPQRAEVIGLRRDGTEFPAGASISRAIIGGDLQLTAILRDLTDRRRVETRAAQLADLLESFDSAVVLAEPDRRLVWANATGRSFLGVDEADVESRTIDDLLAPSSRPRLEDEILPAVWSTGLWRGEVELRLGADDIVLPVMLDVAGQFDATTGNIASVAITAHDISELKEAQTRLRHAASHDVLTGLANRSLFDRHLARALHDPEAAKRTAVLFVDLDHFKPVNDTHGHQIGDAILVSVAGRLQECVRPDDIVARFGGDEFVIVLRRLTDTDEAHQVATRIVAAVSEPHWVEGHEICIGASVGVADADADVDAETLVRHADKAAYEAKRAGRGQVAIHRDGPHD